MSASGMVARARQDLGLGEPNHIQDWYADRNGSAYRYNFAWCDASVTFWAAKSSNHPAVCPAGDRAYTVWHAGDFAKIGRWYSGTAANVRKAKPGDVVFFDWGGTDSRGAIDHVGVVEQVLADGRLQTIEGNTDNACKRRVRSAGSIAGYGRPAYAGSSAPPSPSKVTAPSGSPYLRRGSKGSRVKLLQQALNLAMRSGLAADGDFGAKTEAVVKAMQRKAKIPADGIYGPNSARALARLLG